MVPHAVTTTPADTYHCQNYNNGLEAPGTMSQPRTMIPATSSDDLHDLICVGFGPASLAIAAALHDSIEFRRSGFRHPGDAMPKVAFIERQPNFRWHAGMQLPGATMQISWIKDFATMRNPKSSFTFLNYLFTEGRLLQFSNLGTFLPTRLEYEAYMKWVASWFDHLVEYNQDCLSISPQYRDGEKKSEYFNITTRNPKTGETQTRRTKNVVISCGGEPFIPDHFPQNDARVLHSSSYITNISKICQEREKAYKFMVVGSGQSAGEIFHDLHSRFPNCHTSLMIRQAALKPSDDSPFVNETFNPEHVDDLFESAENVRGADILNDKPTNYGVVRLELLEAIYHDLYMQRVKHNNPNDWQHRILPFREVVAVKSTGDRLRLEVENSEPLHRKGGKEASRDYVDADVLVVAAGYKRNAHEYMLANARNLKPEKNSADQKWTVRRDYSVALKPGAVSDGVGIWLQGSNEATHGLSDTLLSIMAVRGQEVVDSIFGPRKLSR